MTNDEVVQMIIMSDGEKLRIVESYRDVEACCCINNEYRALYADMWCEVVAACI